MRALSLTNGCAILPAVALMMACGNTDQTVLYADPQIRALPQAMIDRVPPDELERMKQYVNTFVKPDAIATSVYMGGDQFDCVQLDRQPSIEKMRDNGEDITAILEELDRPPEKLPADNQDSAIDHKASDPLALEKTTPIPGGSRDSLPPLEVTQPIEEYCPTKTIPVRRIPLEEVAAFGTLDAYLHSFVPLLPGAPTTGFDYVYVRKTGVPSYGIKSTINVWGTYAGIEPNNHNNSQIWIGRGSGTGVDYDSVEVGTDTFTNASVAKLFIFFTNANYQGGTTNCTTSDCSCHNLGCGFVQQNNTVFIGGTLSPASVPGGQQYEMTVSLFKGAAASNWFMTFSSIQVGYWPAANFHHSGGLTSYGDTVTWGGEVFQGDAATNFIHTDANMGDGTQFGGSFPAVNVYAHAAYQRLLKTIEAPPVPGVQPFTTPAFLKLTNTRSACYSGYLGVSDPNWDTWMYFGGPGIQQHACLTSTQAP